MSSGAGSNSKWSRFTSALKWGSRFAALGVAFWGIGAIMDYRSPEQIAQTQSEGAFFSTGSEVWVAPGYTGHIDLYNRDIKSTGNYWEALSSFTLTLHGPSGTADILAHSDKKQDWGNSPWMSEVMVVMYVNVAVPADATAGTDYRGDLTGQIVTGSGFEGMVLPKPINVSLQGIKLHVTTASDVVSRVGAAKQQMRFWPFVQWGASSLMWLLALMCVVRALTGRTPMPMQHWRPGWWQRLMDRIPF